MISQIIENNDSAQLINHLKTNFQYKENSPDTKILGLETSISIEEVRQLISWMHIHPIAGPYKTAVFLHAHNISQVVANAILKLLEEPPQYAQIFLSTSSASSLLPTIQSRCIITKLAFSVTETNNNLEYFVKTDPLKRSSLFPSKREDAILHLDNLLTNSHRLLISDPNNQAVHLICKKIISCKKQLEHNVHLNLAIDHLCITIPRSLYPYDLKSQ